MNALETQYGHCVDVFPKISIEWHFNNKRWCLMFDNMLEDEFKSFDELVSSLPQMLSEYMAELLQD
jgi:hypothetical protein